MSLIFFRKLILLIVFRCVYHSVMCIVCVFIVKLQDFATYPLLNNKLMFTPALNLKLPFFYNFREP